MSGTPRRQPPDADLSEVYVPSGSNRVADRKPVALQPATDCEAAPGLQPLLRSLVDPLMAELAAAFADVHERGRRAPCEGRGEWLSEDPEERAEAVAACGHCPLVIADVCRDVGGRERFGVWGGVDRTPRQRGGRNQAKWSRPHAPRDVDPVEGAA